MSVWRRFENFGYPSLVTTNTADRRPVFSSDTACLAMLAVMDGVRAEERFDILAYVLMPDHAHFVLWLPPPLMIGRVMQLLKGRFSRRYNESRRAAGQLWQERYHERALRDDRALENAIEYVHNNPVAAQLVGDRELYRWSSACDAGPYFRQAKSLTRELG